MLIGKQRTFQFFMTRHLRVKVFFCDKKDKIRKTGIFYIELYVDLSYIVIC